MKFSIFSKAEKIVESPMKKMKKTKKKIKIKMRKMIPLIKTILILMK